MNGYSTPLCPQEKALHEFFPQQGWVGKEAQLSTATLNSTVSFEPENPVLRFWAARSLQVQFTDSSRIIQNFLLIVSFCLFQCAKEETGAL